MPPRLSRGMVREGPGGFLIRACGVLGRACGSAEPLGGDADEPAEVAGEMSLIPEPCTGGDLGQREVVPTPQQQLGPLDPAADEVLMRGQACGGLEHSGEVVGAKVGDGGEVVERQLGVEVLLDVLEGGPELVPGQPPRGRWAARSPAVACLMRWTARTLPSDSVRSRPPAPLEVNSASIARMVPWIWGWIRAPSAGSSMRSGSRSHASAAT